MKIHEALEHLLKNKRIALKGKDYYIVKNLSDDDKIVECNLACMEMRHWCPSLQDLINDDWEVLP